MFQMNWKLWNYYSNDWNKQLLMNPTDSDHRKLKGYSGRVQGQHFYRVNVEALENEIIWFIKITASAAAFKWKFSTLHVNWQFGVQLFNFILFYLFNFIIYTELSFCLVRNRSKTLKLPQPNGLPMNNFYIYSEKIDKNWKNSRKISH